MVDHGADDFNLGQSGRALSLIRVVLLVGKIETRGGSETQN